MSELDFIKADFFLEETWDREWCRYFTKYEGKVWFERCDRISDQSRKMADDLLPATAGTVLHYKSAFAGEPLRIYVDGRNIVGKRVAELGCGVGQLGKQLGHVVEDYIGIDYSPLAIRIATLLSPLTCKYIVLADRRSLEMYKGSRDAVLGRHFFIHQHWENAIWVLKLGRFLLKDTGLLVADFFMNSKNENCLPGRTGMFNPQAASMVFEYTVADIEELAEISGFEIIDVCPDANNARRYVTMKPKK